MILEKNGSYMPRSLVSMSIVVVRLVGRQTNLAVIAFLKFDNFNYKANLGCSNKFMVLIALYQ